MQWKKKRGLVSQRADKNIPMSLKQHCSTQGRKKKFPIFPSKQYKPHTKVLSAQL